MRTGIMLAHPYEPHRVKNWPQDKILVQRKYNGHRCRALQTPQGVKLFSSEANIITSMPHINEALSKVLKPGQHLDGELYCHGMSRQDIQSRVNRKDIHPDHASIDYHIYDIIAKDMTNDVRIYYLHRWLDGQHDHLIEVETEFLPITTALTRITDYVSDGYEGVILRNPYGYYEEKRSKNLLKYKPFYKDTYNVIRPLEAIDQYGNGKNMLGAFQVADYEGHIFSVGAGRLDHATRHALWQEWKDTPEHFLGCKVEVRYPEKSDDRIPVQAVVTSIIKGQRC